MGVGRYGVFGRKKRAALWWNALEKRDDVGAFRRLSSVSKRLIALAETPTVSPQDEISVLLRALGSINEALSIRHSIEVEQKKLELGKQLIQLACESKNYKLAEYLSTEIRSLSIISIADIEKIQQEIQTKKNKTLEDHQRQLAHWLSFLEEHYASEQEKEDAVFEISKMTEEEIRQQLIQILEERKTVYFLQHTAENQLQEQFYEVLIKALGRLNHPKSAPVLLNLLRKMSLEFSIASPPLHKINKMVLLSTALEQSGATQIASEFLEVRLQMGQNGLF